MSDENLLSLHVAEALLAFQTAAYPELTNPDDTNLNPHKRSSNDSSSSHSDFLFTKLLDQERDLERQLSVSGQVAGNTFPYCLSLESDDRMNVSCVESAIIDENEFGPVCIKLCRPLVDGLITAGRERPLSDQVRVFSYLVRLSCQLVGSRGGVKRLSSDTIRFLRETVRILSELVRTARLKQSDNTSNRTEQTTNSSNPSPKHIPIHDTDSNRKEE